MADVETRRGDIPAFYSLQPHRLHQADCLNFCTLCCVILNLMIFPDVFLREPHPETGVVRAPTASLTGLPPPPPRTSALRDNNRSRLRRKRWRQLNLICSIFISREWFSSYPVGSCPYESFCLIRPGPWNLLAVGEGWDRVGTERY